MAVINLWLIGLEQAGRLPAISLPAWLNVFGGSTVAVATAEKCIPR